MAELVIEGDMSALILNPMELAYVQELLVHAKPAMWGSKDPVWEAVRKRTHHILLHTEWHADLGMLVVELDGEIENLSPEEGS